MQKKKRKKEKNYGDSPDRLFILTGADFCAGTGLLNNNNNNNNNNMASPGPSGNKLSEMLRAGSQPGSAQQYHDEMQSQQQRMTAVMAAAAVSAGKGCRLRLFFFLFPPRFIISTMMMMTTMTTMITIDRGRRSSFKVAFDIPVIEGRRESSRYLSLSLSRSGRDERSTRYDG